MWSYYGSKANVVDCYPAPRHSKIIEPFAGTARYALKYFDREVLLVDKDEVIIRIWRWLQQCVPADIKKLPRLKPGDDLNTLSFSCEEERWLLGFIAGFGLTYPANKVSPHRGHRPNSMNYTINFIADSLYKIRHWEIRCGDYDKTPDQEATWFIDPPYERGGQSYRHGNKNISYSALAKFCTGRKGQVIVCENATATWLDFKPMINQRTLRGYNAEGIWSNHPTPYDHRQGTLFESHTNHQSHEK